LNLGRNIRAAFSSVVDQGRRAILSALGVVVGTVAIVLLVSIAIGVQDDIRHEVDKLGVNVLVILPGRVDTQDVFSPNLMGISYLSDADVERVRKVPGVLRAAPLMFVGGGIRRGERLSPTTFVVGAGPDWFKIHPEPLEAGRYYGPEDAGRAVVVIGSVAKQSLFGNSQAIGQTVTINGHTFTVVGVTHDKQSEQSLFSMGGFENMAYYPYTLAQRLSPTPMLHRIMVQTRPDVEPQSLVKSVEATMAQRLDSQLFSVVTQEDLLRLVFKIMGILTWLLTGLTSIALFVAGVGIMTVMLMSVGERAKEIGIRKTAGATRADIFVQFLTEAVVITLLGGAVGFVLSWLVCDWLAANTPIKPEITWGVAGLSFGTSVLVGAVFGILPALRAASQDPIVALRTE